MLEMFKSQNQATQDQQLPDQSQQLHSKEQNKKNQDKFHNQSSFNYHQGLPKGERDHQIHLPQNNYQNRNRFSFKCMLKIILILLIVNLVVYFLPQIQKKERQSQKYINNMIILSQQPKENQKMDNTFIQYQPQQLNNKQRLIKKQYKSNQIEEEKALSSIKRQKKEINVLDNAIPLQEIKLNKTAGTIQSNETKIPTFKEMYQQFLKKQQRAQLNEADDSDHLSQLVINPVIYPFNQQFPIDQLYNQYGTFTGISPQTLSKAKKWNQITTSPQDPSSIQQMIYYESRYQISKYEQLPFCIVVPTFNNAYNNRYLMNIQSIIIQNYKNYHIVIIDDASEDNTVQFIQKYLQEQKIELNKYVILQNQVRVNAMPNLRNAAKNYCKPQEIFMIVDGDDKLIGRQVFKLFNAVFQQKKLWFVYSNFLLKNRKVGYSRPFPKSTIRKKSFRRFPFVTSHLRAFYTKLFLNIEQKDVMDQDGQYFKAANDVAIYLPILQQAQERIGYLPEITYNYNSDTGLNNHQLRFKEQRTNQRTIRKRRSYQRLESLMD